MVHRGWVVLIVVWAGISAGLAWDLSVFGGGVTGSDITPVATILAHPAALEGKVVRVRGRVTAVCEKMGCWMDLQVTGGDKIQIKVTDGEIAFPPSAVGKDAIAEGVVEILKLSRDEYLAMKQHQAEENGQTFDAASVADGPFEIVRIQGTGAVIQD